MYMHKTMALKITEATYPVAVACMPPGFMFIKLEFVLGAYLVINNIKHDPDARNWEEKVITLNNIWCSEKEFFDTYEFITTEPKRGQFGEVRSK